MPAAGGSNPSDTHAGVKPLRSTKFVAHALGKSPDWILSLVRNGQIRHRRVGKRIYFLDEDVIDFQERILIDSR